MFSTWENADPYFRFCPVDRSIGGGGSAFDNSGGAIIWRTKPRAFHRPPRVAEMPPLPEAKGGAAQRSAARLWPGARSTWQGSGVWRALPCNPLAPSPTVLFRASAPARATSPPGGRPRVPLPQPPPGGGGRTTGRRSARRSGHQCLVIRQPNSPAYQGLGRPPGRSAPRGFRKQIDKSVSFRLLRGHRVAISWRVHPPGRIYPRQAQAISSANNRRRFLLWRIFCCNHQ
jgi:hypothetical protein